MNDSTDEFGPTVTVRDAYRPEALATLPKSYRPMPHLCFEFGLYAIFVALPMLFLRDWRWYHALTIPAAFVVGNVFEWALHKNFMHVRRKPYFIYDAHTRRHHRLYWHQNMAMQTWRELPFVTFGPVTFIGIVAHALAFAAIAWLILGRNPALFFLAAEMSYITLYECLHLMFHRPASSPVWKLGLIRWLGARHTQHHNPRLMRTRNFNVTFPLADWLFGTLAPPAGGGSASGGKEESRHERAD